MPLLLVGPVSEILATTGLATRGSEIAATTPTGSKCTRRGRGIQVGRASSGYPADDLFVGRIDHLANVAILRSLPAAVDEQTVLARLAQLQRRRTLGTLPRIQGALLELIGFATENHADELQSLSESRVHLQGRSDALRRVLKYLLAHSRDRVYAVANAVGFADEAYFTRRFRQRFSVSPSQCRRAMQSGLEPATG